MHPPLLILMGPTASGKSALGLLLAKALGGEIINADAMQCYADLRIITARPTQAEQAGTPHHLYGVWSWQTHGHAALWRDAAWPIISRIHAENKLPILLGGTGLYLRTLTHGLANIPNIDPALHEATKNSWAADKESFLAELALLDPTSTTSIKPNDGQRLIRAMEVVRQTSIPLSTWQQENAAPLFDLQQCLTCVVDIPRPTLYERINQRFEQMLISGAIEEVKTLKEKIGQPIGSLPTLPLLKAHGVPEMMAYLDGKITQETLLEKGKQHTRNYAKRQLTWLRNQCPEAQMLPYDLASDPEKMRATFADLAKRLDRPLANL